MRVEYIRWNDACYVTAEEQHSQLGDLVELHEVGFLIKETDQTVVICSEYQENAVTSRQTLTIPKVSIIERREIDISKPISPKKKTRSKAVDHGK